MSSTKSYEEILSSSKIATPGLVKGTLFIYPKGWHIWEQIQKYLNKEYKCLGIKNVAFPALIPLLEIEKEKEKLHGFKPELYLVKRSGDEDNSLFLRPTSEILFSYFFKKELQSYSQLPLLFNQWCNVYRSEKNTKAFLRTCEFYWQEAHTLHASKEEAFDYLNKFHEIYKKVIKEVLCLAFLEGEKTINERFQGAEKTLALEAIMPDGQALQIATSHFLDQNFSRMFEVKYTNTQNTLDYPYQLSAGSSTRLIGALILGHSDENGLVLPFDVSDVQIKILVMKEVVTKDDSTYKEIQNQLLDYEVEWEFSSKKSFGFRISETEVAGIPFVLVIGENELKSKQVMFKSRISKEKLFFNFENLKTNIEEEKKIYSKKLLENSENKLNELLVDLTKGATLEEVKENILTNKKIVLVPWLNDEKNEEKFKNEGFGFGARCIKGPCLDENAKCFYSGEKANSYVYFGRSY